MSFPPSEPDLAKILRGLIVADIVISVPLALASGVLTEAALREAGISQDPSPADSVTAAFLCMMVVVLIPAQIMSWIGLFSFRSWARWLYLGTVVVSVLSTIPVGFLDVSYTWGLPDAISDIGAPLTGAILALVFLSPVAKRFERPLPVPASFSGPTDSDQGNSC